MAMVVMTAMMMMKYRHTERFVTLNKMEVVPMTKTWKFVREVMVVVVMVIMMMMMVKYWYMVVTAAVVVTAVTI